MFTSISILDEEPLQLPHISSDETQEENLLIWVKGGVGLDLVRTCVLVSPVDLHLRKR